MKTKLISILVMAMIAISSFAKDSALKTAITAQDFDRVKAALDAGCDPNESLGTSTILSWAANWGCNAEMVKLLIDKGAKVDGVGSLALTPLAGLVWAKNNTPEEIVARNNKTNDQMLKRIKKEVLMQNGWWAQTDITKFSTPLEIAKVLLDAGADPNYVLGSGAVKIGTPFLSAIKEGKFDLVKLMLDSKKVDTEYRFDSYAEKSIKVSNKLGAGRYGGAATERDWAEIPMFNTPLLYAIDKQNLDLVKMLIEAGADINNGKKHEWGETGAGVSIHHWELWTPLDVAKNAKNPNNEIIDYLISKGAVSNQK